MRNRARMSRERKLKKQKKTSAKIIMPSYFTIIPKIHKTMLAVLAAVFPIWRVRKYQVKQTHTAKQYIMWARARVCA